ncbi:hypothetical protein GCM10007905_09480 [Mixta theicola]|nr:hypothetical protein GCM10007905_09480 [Mixta theicola]
MGYRTVTFYPKLTVRVLSAINRSVFVLIDVEVMLSELHKGPVTQYDI